MSHGSSRRILIVDDDQIVLDSLSQGLSRAGFNVTQCRSATEALEVYAQQAPDLAIVDIGLPDLRGTVLAERMLERRYRPILILSSHTEPEWVRRAIGSGAIGYLVKPLTPAQLIPSIETSLARFGDINRSIASNFGYGTASPAQIQGALDQFPFGVAIVDQDRQIILCNNAARRFLENARLLRSINGKLATAVRNESLEDLLDRCLGTSGIRPKPAAYSVRKPECEDTIHILGIPLYASDSGAERTASVLIKDSSQTTAVPSHLFKSLYGLTEKESRLAHALMNGMTLNEYCEKVFVTINTARTHLKSIYRKTSTNRQGELISLLSRLYINLPEADDGDGE